jgi:hypothetical protein
MITELSLVETFHLTGDLVAILHHQGVGLFAGPDGRCRNPRKKSDGQRERE